MPKTGGGRGRSGSSGSRGRSSFGGNRSSFGKSSFGSRGRSGFGGSSFSRPKFGIGYSSSLFSRNKRRPGSSYGGRSSGPSAATIERMSMPVSSPSGFYFPYDPENNKFDLSTYNNSFCDGRVTQQELEAINAGLHQIPPPPVGCPCRLLMALVTLLVTAAIMVCLGLFFDEGKILVSGSEYSYLRLYKYVNVEPMHIGIMLGVSAFLGLGLTIYLCCSSCSQVQSEQVAFNLRLTGLFNQQQQSVFGPKQMTLRLSPYQTYMSVTFNWKASPPQQAFGMIPQQEQEHQNELLLFGGAPEGQGFSNNAQMYGMQQPGSHALGPPVFS